MSRKLIQKTLKIDLGNQPNFRGGFGAVLELIWASFGGQIGTFGCPGGIKMGRLELEPCSPATSWLPAGAKEAFLQFQGGPKSALEAPKWPQNDPRRAPNTCQGSKNRPQGSQKGAQTDPQTFKMDTLSSKSRPPRLPQSTPWSRFSVLCSQLTSGLFVHQNCFLN